MTASWPRPLPTVPFAPFVCSVAVAAAALPLAGCGEGDREGDPTETPALASTPSPSPLPTAAPRCEAEEVRCEDQLILDLGLVEGVTSAGALTTTREGATFMTKVDATAGGFGASADNPWIYLRFTQGGAERVDVDDLDALESTDWHVAFKRYLIRLNSGTSGPSCVTASPVDGAFDDVAAVPSGASFAEEDFYDDGCALVADDKGLGSADVRLGAWWGYNGCVNTTGQVFLIQLPSGEVVKWEALSYYEEGQATCNAEGTPGKGSANFLTRWAFL